MCVFLMCVYMYVCFSEVSETAKRVCMYVCVYVCISISEGYKAATRVCMHVCILFFGGSEATYQCASQS